MYRSPKGVLSTLLLAALLFSATPVLADTPSTFVSQFWHVILNWLDGDRGADPDPNGLDTPPTCQDPNGSPDRGCGAEPDGLTWQSGYDADTSDRGSGAEPNG